MYAHSTPNPTTATPSKRRPYHLLGIACSCALIWMTVLPWLAQLPSTRLYLERLDARGIDPAAMYYTELPPELFLDAEVFLKGGRMRQTE